MIIAVLTLATGLLLMVIACAMGAWAYEKCTTDGGRVVIQPWTPITPHGGITCVTDRSD